MAGCGDCFMLPKAGHDVEHLWIILSNPHPDSGEALMVNLTTLRAGSDKTVVLDSSDHPFISHPSVIFYADARTVKVEQLDEARSLGILRPKSPMSRETLTRIQEGLLTSPFTPRKIKGLFRDARRIGLALAFRSISISRTLVRYRSSAEGVLADSVQLLADPLEAHGGGELG